MNIVDALKNNKKIRRQINDNLWEVKENLNLCGLKLLYYVDNNDLKQGEFKAWWPDNVLGELCFYVDDKREGDYKQWDRIGNLVQYIIYENDKQVKHILFKSDNVIIGDIL